MPGKSFRLSFVIFSLSLLLLASGYLQIAAPQAQSVSEKAPVLQGEAAIQQLRQRGEYDSLQEAMRQARFTVQRAEQTPLRRAAWHAPNRSAGYDGYVTEEGVSIALSDDVYVSLTLRSISYGEWVKWVGAGRVSGDKQSIRLERDEKISEWYVNSESGLEQGFTLSEPPGGAKQRGLPLRLSLEVSDGWLAVASEDGQRVTLLGKKEGEAVEYTKLVVWDANGSPVKAALLVEDERVVIEVEDAAAVYPLTIDPTFVLQQKVTASVGNAAAQFGFNVALSGETAVVGAWKDDVGTNLDQGAAYVFVRQGATWSQQARLTALDGAAGDSFGIGVAISGNTVVVGAVYADVSGRSDQGAAYVFTRSGTVWTQQQKLTANDGLAGDEFGYSVAMSGDTVVVGARWDDVGMNDKQGSVYVFVRSGVIWTQQQRLTASDGAANHELGVSVALEGNTLVAGAWRAGSASQGAAYVFVRSGVTWTQQQRLAASGGGVANDFFGYTVALSGETALIGAWSADVVNVSQGAAYVFVRSGTTWTEQQRLTANDGVGNDQFGIGVAISGNVAVVGSQLADVNGNTNQGAAYYFMRNGTTWTQQDKFTAGDGAAQDNFGASVALSGETCLVGSPFDDVGINADQGSAYFFTLSSTPNVQAKLTAMDNMAGDEFGCSIAMSGDTVVVGVITFLSATQGAAYVFVRNGTTWTQQQKLIAPDGDTSDRFGLSVALSGNIAVVGAPFDYIGGEYYTGSAYVFVRNGTTWTQQQRLNASDSQILDAFGWSVAANGDTVVVGSLVGGNNNQGAAYVFVRNGTTWTEQKQLTASDGEAFDEFGGSVAMIGDTVVVGAPKNDVEGKNKQGSAYVFVRNGTTWTQQQKLTAADGEAFDEFGGSVAMSGDTVVVGTDLRLLGTEDGNNLDSAYVFVRAGTTWTQQQKLTALDGEAFDEFGSSVSVSGDTVVVGAPSDMVGANLGQGSAYVFVRNGTTWTRQQKLIASDGAASDLFGHSVVLNGDTVVVGAPFDFGVVTNVDIGSAYIYVLCRYDLTPSSANFPASGGNGSFTIQCNGACDWTATALPAWMTITSSPSGTGNGTITFTVAANPGLPRSSSISINDQSFFVTQEGTCPLTLNPAGLPGGVIGTAYNQPLTASGGNGSYSYQLANGTTLPPGLSLSAGGVIAGTPTASAGNYTFTIAALDTNGCVGTRTYTMNIATCAVTSLSPTSASVGSSGGTGSFTVTAPGCSWTTLRHAPWLVVTTNAMGTGNLSVSYAVASNASGAARTGQVTVNNQTFTVNQAAGSVMLDYDQDGIPDDVELTEGTQFQVKDNDVFANTALGRRLFVMQQYRDFLGREGDPAGIQAWVNVLSSGSLTRAQVIEAFFNSPEFQQSGAPIVRLYFAYFNRIPDYPGLIFWANLLRGGMSLHDISQQFATSPEFINTYGSLSNPQFVVLVYQNVLGRTPSQSEVDAWVALLNAGTTRGQVMVGFSESPEFKARSANQVYVTMMYVGMLRRSPEQAGFDAWIGYLNAGNSGLALIQGFLDALEYRNRFLP